MASVLELQKMTVSDLKVELKRRAVPFKSKLRMKELLDLLTASLHLPVVVADCDAQATQKASKSNKLKNWKNNDPVRRLPYVELQERNIPLDPNEMGPAQIYSKCHGTVEFEGVQYDDLFIHRLKNLRQQVMKEEPLLKWNENHPGRALLLDELAEGRIPLSTKTMGPAQVWSNYCDTPQFKM